MIRIGSLCSGVGGLELGLERAGIGTTAWQVEYDPHASEVLARHWDVPNLGDVKATDWTQVEPVDVICAGYPCQPFSTAGRRQGTEDERHLWPAVRDAVGVLGPRLVVLENVRGHLSLGFPEVLGDLADLGFDAGWCLLRASDVGAPHQRARLFVVAYAKGEGLEGARLRGRPALDGGTTTDAEGTERRAAQPQAVPPLERRRDPQAEQLGVCRSEGDRPDHLPTAWGPYRPAIERWEAIHGPAPAPTTDGRLSPEFVCWMQGFPPGWVDGLTRTAALRCLGNAVVPQVAERFGRMILGEVGGGVVPPDATLLPTPTSSHPGGTLEGYHDRLRSSDGRDPGFVPLNMLVEQVLA